MIMWSEKMAVSRDEAKRILRRLELEAYSSIISVFRAQGDLDRDKKKILTELGGQLSISTERHRAEIRRAYSDDRLGAVAECIYGPSTCAEWAAEGRRLVPLMPRLVPQTVLTATATAAANSAAALNAKLPATSQAKPLATATGPNSNGISSATSSMSTGSAKASALKVLSSAQGTQAVDGELEGEDGKSKKRRRLSQSIATPKPVPKIVTPTPALVTTKANIKTTSVSTMTKGGKASTSTGIVKIPPKVSLPASASQVKLLTKTVAISQTVCQAKTMLNYKTVSATSPAAVKVQTVSSHTTPKAQVKVAVPPNVSPTKTLLVPKAHASTSPGKPSVGFSLPKTGMTTAQILAKQRTAKQQARFKTLPGTVKFKSMTPATMGTCSTVTMVTPSPAAQTTAVTTIASLPSTSTQPIVKIIQVPGTGGLGISKPVVVMTTGLSKAPVPGTLPVSAGTKPIQPTAVVPQGITALKLPLSSTSAVAAPPLITMTTQANRPITTPAQRLPATATKTVVMTTMVDGGKKVVLSMPAPVKPIQTKTVNIPSTLASNTVSTQGLGTVMMSVPTAAPTKLAPTKPELSSAQKKPAVPSLECTEPSSVLPGPTPIAPKPSTAPTTTTQVRTRPLPAILPAPPKHTGGQVMSTVTATPGVRKLPQILPAPAKTAPPAMLVPIVPSTAPVNTAGASVASTKVVKPVSVAKGGVAQPSIHSAKTTHIPSVSVTSAPKIITISKDKPKLEPELKKTDNVKDGTKTDLVGPKVVVVREDQIYGTPSHANKIGSQTEKKQEVDSNESSEDESIDLVCSETIDVTAGRQDLSPGLGGASKTAMGTSLNAAAVQPPINAQPRAAEPFSMESNISPQHSVPVSLPNKSAILSSKAPISSTCDNEQKSQQCNKQNNIPTMSVFPESLKEPNKHDGSNSGDKFDITEPAIKNPVNDVSSSLPDFAAVSSFLQSFSNEQEHSAVPVNTSGSPPIDRPTSNFNTNDKYGFHQAFPESSTVVKTPDFSSPLSYHTDTPRNSQESPDNSCGLTSSSGSSELGDIAFALDPACPSTDHSSEVFNMQSTAETDPSDINIDVVSALPNEHGSIGFIDGASAQSCHNELTNETHLQSGALVDAMGLTDSERQALEAIANVRTSGRKRKAPIPLNVSPPRHSSGWVRGALSVLQKVSSYRGQGRRKGDISAASWFLRPVDPNDAPGYYKVIKTPMDFSTIKSNLESGMYEDYTGFHDDMLLVKSNCFKYNPPGHDVRNDCEEVFSFYESEYFKMLERWEKCHVSPAKKPRPAAKLEFSSSS